MSVNKSFSSSLGHLLVINQSSSVTDPLQTPETSYISSDKELAGARFRVIVAIPVSTSRSVNTKSDLPGKEENDRATPHRLA